MGGTRCIVPIVSLLALGGCGFLQDWGRFTVGGEDAGPRVDAGPGADAGPFDAGPGTDAGPTDGGPRTDAGPFDAGTSCAENPIPSSDVGPAVFTGDTVAATHRITPSCRGGTAPDRQFRWTAPADGTYRFTTEGSSYDTVLSIQANCDGMELACDDDAAGGGSWSDLSIDVTAGQTIIVNVDGFSGMTGAFQVNIGRGRCGDGTVNLDLEACDDGNTSNLDGCSASCVVEDIEGALRIAGGPDASEGRLEVYHMGMWGTVCDDPAGGSGWDAAARNADIACRQLGFTSGVAVGSVVTADGAGMIWLDGVQCAGGEARLVDCDCGDPSSCAMPAAVCTTRWGCEDCTHSEDIGVDCTP